MSGRNWKDGLLSSSLPLEFETAKLLAKRDFGVSADYTYGRIDNNSLKEFSVDIHAYSYPANRVIFNLLVECKQKSPNKKWLFLPDPNEPDWDRFIPGSTLRFVDEFSGEYFGSKDAFRRLERQIPVAYKGTEINLAKGEVYDTDIKHGIAQLRYALPRLLREMLEDANVIGEAGLPFIMCPILVTTADLLMMNKTASLSKVTRCSNLEQLSKSVPYVILRSDYGPDFENYCRHQEFMYLTKFRDDFEANEYLKALEIRRSRIKAHVIRLPSKILRGLIDVNPFYMNRYFSQFLVVNFSQMREFMELLSKSVNQTVRTLRKLPRVKSLTKPVQN